MGKTNSIQPGFDSGQSELFQSVEKQGAPMVEDAVEKKETLKKETTANEAARSPAPEKKVQKPDETYMYIGPTIPQSPLKENAIFHGEKDSVLEFVHGAVERYPLVKRLIVHIDLLAASKNKLDTGGNALSKAYQELAEALKNRKEG